MIRNETISKCSNYITKHTFKYVTDFINLILKNRICFRNKVLFTNIKLPATIWNIFILTNKKFSVIKNYYLEWKPA